MIDIIIVIISIPLSVFSLYKLLNGDAAYTAWYIESEANDLKNKED